MGYSQNLDTLKSRIHLFEKLEKGEACQWETAEGVSARSLAYQIREALYIARLYRYQFEAMPDSPEKVQLLAIADASDRFRIEIVGPTLVQARFASGPTEAKILALPESAMPHHNLEPGPTQQMVAPKSAYEIIEYMLRKQPSNEKEHFPRATLTTDELVKLWNWANAQTPRWLLFSQLDGGVTLTRYRRDVVDYAWQPADIGLEGVNEVTDEEEPDDLEEGEFEDPKDKLPKADTPAGMDLDVEDKE